MESEHWFCSLYESISTSSGIPDEKMRMLIQTAVFNAMITCGLWATAPDLVAIQPPSSGDRRAVDGHEGHSHAQGAQDVPEEGAELNPSAADIPDEDQTPLAQEYRAAITDLRQVLKSSRKVYVEYYVAKKDEPEKYLMQWLAVGEEVHKKMDRVRESMIKLYIANSGRYRALGDALYFMANKDANEDRPETSMQIYEALIEAGYEAPGLFEKASRAAYASNQFAKAALYLRRSIAFGAPIDQSLPLGIEMLEQQWQEELNRRRREEAANDLPRVEFITTKGVIEVELFEDDFPETVNNFIYLVEHNYYDAKPLFRVERHAMAQTGCERGDGTGTPGYTIKGEFTPGRSRGHFRGSIGLALSIDEKTRIADPNSGSGQFYFCLSPMPQNDGQYCVFGRITKGIETLGFFNPVDMTQKEQRNAGGTADSIVRARVVRKRDHEYKPTPFTGRLLY